MLEAVADTLVQRLRDFRRRRVREARPRPPGGVGDQGELAHDERLASDVENRAIEAPALVLEDAKPRDLAGEPVRLVIAVTGRDADEHDEAAATARANLTAHAERGGRHPLDDGAHRRILAAQVLDREADKEDMEAAHHPWPALGALLLRDGLVDSDELESVLTHQEEAGHHRISARRLGELLVERGTVTYAQVAQLLAEQYELPFIELAASDVNLRAASLLPEEQAHRFSALPISVLPDASVLVATSDPPLVLFSDEFRRLLGVPLRYAVAAQDEVDQAIAHVASHASLPETEERVSALPVDPQQHEPDTDAWLAAADDEPSITVPEHPRAHRSAALGALLLRDGLVTERELERALAQQRITGNRRLGEILVESGSVTRAEVARLVAEQYDLPFVEVEISRIEHGASRLLSEGLARRLSALPLGHADDGSLLVVVTDPTNVVYADELRDALEVPLRFAVGAPDEIETAIDAVYEHSLAPASHAEHPLEHASEPELEVEPEFELEVEVADETEPVASTPVVAVPVDEQPAADDADPEDEAPAHAEAPPLFDGVPVWEIEDEILAAVEELPIARFDDYPETMPEHERDEPSEHETHSEPLAVVQELPVSPAPAHLDEDLLAEVEETVETAAVAVAEPLADDDAGAADLSDDTTDSEPASSADDDALETIRRALSLGATTVQLSPQPRGLVVRARIEGSLRELAVFVGAAGTAVTSSVVELAGLEPVDGLQRHGVLSLADGERIVDLAASAVPTRLGLQVTLRAPGREGPPSTLSELPLGASSEAALREALRLPFGVVVVCGPVVSGRTTTLYALVEELVTPDRAVATVESPIHRLLTGTSQVDVTAVDGASFPSALRAVLRSDPDAVLVGDLRDDESARVSFSAARADRLILAALEAPTTSSAVVRLAELGVEPNLLASTLSCVVAQHLVRRICPDCRETYYASAEEVANLGRPEEESGRRLLARGRGCASCAGTGFRGFAVVFEVLQVSDRIRSLVTEGATAAMVRDAAAEDGMTTLREAAVGLCLDGVTSAAEVLQVAVD